jgi:hypothetical protein
MVHYLLIITSHFVNQNYKVQIDYLITLIGANQFVQIDRVVFLETRGETSLLHIPKVMNVVVLCGNNWNRKNRNAINWC